MFKRISPATQSSASQGSFHFLLGLNVAPVARNDLRDRALAAFELNLRKSSPAGAGSTLLAASRSGDLRHPPLKPRANPSGGWRARTDVQSGQPQLNQSAGRGAAREL